MASSPLGRWLRRRAADEWQAEGRYLVVLTLLVTALLLAHLLLWTVLPLTGPTVLIATAATLLVLLPATVGRQPGISIRCESDHLRISRGSRTSDIPLSQITGHEQVEALAYHRHWRRYAGTRTFVNRIPDRVLLLHTDDGPIALGLDPADQQRLLACLETSRHAAAQHVAETVER